MPTFAKVQNDIALNPFVVLSQDDLANAAHADWFAQNGGIEAWSQVPDGTHHGAVKQPDGTYLNPAIPVQTTPASLDIRGVRDHLVNNVFGGGNDGRVRYGHLKVAILASEVPIIVYARDELTDAGRLFSKQEIGALLNVCQANDLPSADTTPGNLARKIADAEKILHANTWPEV